MAEVPVMKFVYPAGTNNDPLTVNAAVIAALPVYTLSQDCQFNALIKGNFAAQFVFTPQATNVGFSALTLDIFGSMDDVNYNSIKSQAVSGADLIKGSAIATISNIPMAYIRLAITAATLNGTATSATVSAKAVAA